MANPENKQLKKLGQSKIPRAISPMGTPPNTLKHISFDKDIPKRKEFVRHQFMSLRLPSPRTPPAPKSSPKPCIPSSHAISSTATSFKQKVLRFCHLAKAAPPPKPRPAKMVNTPSKNSQKVEKFEKELESVVAYNERTKRALEVQNELLKKYMWQISELKEVVQYLNAEVYVLKTQQEEFEKKGLSVNPETVDKLYEFLKDLKESKMCGIGEPEEDAKNTWGYFEGCCDKNDLFYRLALS